MVPQLFNLARSPLKGDIPNKNPLYKVYMGLIIKGTIPRVPTFSLWLLEWSPSDTDGGWHPRITSLLSHTMLPSSWDFPWRVCPLESQSDVESVSARHLKSQSKHTRLKLILSQFLEPFFITKLFFCSNRFKWDVQEENIELSYLPWEPSFKNSQLQAINLHQKHDGITYQPSFTTVTRRGLDPNREIKGMTFTEVVIVPIGHDVSAFSLAEFRSDD